MGLYGLNELDGFLKVPFKEYLSQEIDLFWIRVQRNLNVYYDLPGFTATMIATTIRSCAVKDISTGSIRLKSTMMARTVMF
jgi:hypothetical protein